MFLTGFADEAAPDVEGQIETLGRLGWTHIESRSIDGANIHDIDADAFARAADLFAEAGIEINCFGSGIGNWSQSVEDDFAPIVEQTKRAIERMQRTGTRMIRVMSFKVLEGRGPDDQMAEERFARLRTLTELFLAADIQPVHENCMNYGGMSARHTLHMLENVPGLKLVFDTGNPVFTLDASAPEPRPHQSAWAFYEAVRDHVVYVHIKDGVWDEAEGKARFCWAGEGQGDVERIVADLLARSYDGGFSMEPHMQSVFHEGRAADADDRERTIQGFVEYGRRFEALVDSIKARD